MASAQQPSDTSDSPAPQVAPISSDSANSSIPEEQPPAFRPKGPPSKPATGKPKT